MRKVRKRGESSGNRLRHTQKDRRGASRGIVRRTQGASASDAQSGQIDVDEAEAAENLELPGADLSGEQASCSSCASSGR